MQKPKDINAVVEEKNHIPKRWLKYHYIPSKSVMESKRRWVCTLLLLQLIIMTSDPTSRGS